MQTQKRARSAKKAIFPPVRKTGPRAQHTKNTLIVLILLLVKKESSSQSSLHTPNCHVIPSHQRCSYPLQGCQSEWRAKSPAGTCRFSRLMIETSLLLFTIRKHVKIHFFSSLSNFHKILDFSIPKLLSELQIYTSLKKNSKLAKTKEERNHFFFLIELFNEKIQ